MQIAGTVALVTGGASGLGEAAVRSLVAAGGRAVILDRPGSPGETVAVDLGRLTNLEKDLLTAYSASIDVQQEAAELVFGRAVRVAELVSHRLPVARGVEAMALAAGKAPGTLKVVLGRGAAA